LDVVQSKDHKAGEGSPINSSDRDVSHDDLVRAIIDDWLVPALVAAFIREVGGDRGASADVEHLLLPAHQQEKSAQQMEK
jgi:hypothetical protein